MIEIDIELKGTCHGVERVVQVADFSFMCCAHFYARKTPDVKPHEQIGRKAYHGNDSRKVERYYDRKKKNSHN